MNTKLDTILSSTTTQQNRVRTIVLSPQQAKSINDLATTCLREYGDASNKYFIEEAGWIAHDLPKSVRKYLNLARLDPLTHVTVILGNTINQKALGPTPAHWQEANNSESQIYSCMLVLYASLLGDIIGWSSQQDGRLLTDVLPSIGHEESLVSSCSKRELSWHTEDAFSINRADWVGLLGLRCPYPVATTISYIEEARIPKDILKVLSQQRFIAIPDSSHAIPQEHYNLEPVAILERGGILRIDRDFFQAQEGDNVANQALAWITKHIDENIYEININSGNVCFIDNRNVVHGRRPFVAKFNGNDRWLKRVNIVRDLRKIYSGHRSKFIRVIGS